MKVCYYVLGFVFPKRVVINTWPFVEANVAAWNILKTGGSALDSITAGTSVCEVMQCDGSVGWGNHPDEAGEVTLDAMIMDGQTADVGAVGGLRRVKHAAKVARHVLDNTDHTLLVGQKATEFALQMGFKNESLSSNSSQQVQTDWLLNNCQPNFWKNVFPDPKYNCGPYSPTSFKQEDNDVLLNDEPEINRWNHDTIGMVAYDQYGKSASGTSTNGLNHKITGRVGDSPIPGAGSYINDAGGAAATGDGDVMIRFLPSYQAVENMRLGMTPRQAALDALARIVEKYEKFSGALITINNAGSHGAACHNIQDFPYVATSDDSNGTHTIRIMCSVTFSQLKGMMKTAFFEL